jgi:hypothetical protein
MWKCKSCNSTEVEALDWVDLNSGDTLEDDLDEYYCRSCQSQVDIYYEDDEETDTSTNTMLDD